MLKYAHLNRDVNKMGPFIYQSMKNGSVINSFLEKRGLIVYLAAQKRGLLGPHIRTMSYIGSTPPPPRAHYPGLKAINANGQCYMAKITLIQKPRIP